MPALPRWTEPLMLLMLMLLTLLIATDGRQRQQGRDKQIAAVKVNAALQVVATFAALVAAVFSRLASFNYPC